MAETIIPKKFDPQTIGEKKLSTLIQMNTRNIMLLPYNPVIAKECCIISHIFILRLITSLFPSTIYFATVFKVPFKHSFAITGL